MATTNSVGTIVSGSKVQIIGNDKIYDVGEISHNTARLYSNSVYIITMPIENLKAV